MKTIWKFSLRLAERQVVLMPAGSDILSVQIQSGVICLWAMVNSDAKMEVRIIDVLGTGNPVSDAEGIHRTFIGTVHGGGFVWHVFERQDG